MTEITNINSERLPPAVEKFILHWGDMGSQWGVNRTVAQIHALLYLAPDPLPAEEIAATLAVARSNVSTSLKELQSWNLVKVSHVMGDRRDHFVARTDTWDMLLTIMERRLDNIVHRLGWAPSRPAARQMVSHGHVTVNGQHCNIPSMLLRQGDKVSVKSRPRGLQLVRLNLGDRPAPIPDFMEMTGPSRRRP